MNDVVVVGGGPAGFTAAIYAARYKLNTLLITQDIGGQIAQSHKICNYPGFSDIDGVSLSNKMLQHVKDLDVPVAFETVNGVEKTENGFIVKTATNSYETKKVIFTGGTEHRHLGIPGEKEFAGKGVSYCATCDAAFFRDKKIAVIGGGDAAVKAALLLADFGEKVYVIYRKDHFFRAEPAWIELVEQNDKIEILFNEEITEIKGESIVTAVHLKNKDEDLAVDGVFVEIGVQPKLEFLDNLALEKNEGYIKVDSHQVTNVPGFFGAGDITNPVLKQIITAASQGAVAAYSAYNELTKER
jgi:thioredoxin-disulfide reductase